VPALPTRPRRRADSWLRSCSRGITLRVLRALEARELHKELPQEIRLALRLLAQRPQLRELALGEIDELDQVFTFE
jgi:hypothetical protein